MDANSPVCVPTGMACAQCGGRTPGGRPCVVWHPADGVLTPSCSECLRDPCTRRRMREEGAVAFAIEPFRS